MNAVLPDAARVASEQKVVALMATVERLVAERRDADALRLFREAEALLPDHPLVLHERARRLLQAAMRRPRMRCSSESSSLRRATYRSG